MVSLTTLVLRSRSTNKERCRRIERVADRLFEGGGGSPGDPTHRSRSAFGSTNVAMGGRATPDGSRVQT